MKFKKAIAVVDDEILFRKGIKGLLAEFKHLEVIIEAEHGKDLLEKLRVQQPDVVLLDIQMPVMNGIETTEALRKRYPKLKIIIITSYGNKELMFSLIEKGANAFLTKNTDIKVIVKAINQVLEKGYYFDYETSQAMVAGIIESNKPKPSFKKPKLSGRELEVLKLICKEHTNREIADILCLSPRTIDTYRENIIQKTGAKNVVGVAFYAVRNKLHDFAELTRH
ncbi:MAG TPA: response regulator transcription factor [Bacteroidia bacterium]|jgi:DNA-binding NarL/FixJ family response regulator|nr:response regulator transcription factor [Bacteroidia bacterium]